jgi:cytidylate kinase
MDNNHLVITINHQLGSGGAYLGQKLSERLGLPFIDRDVLKKVAEQLNLAEAVLDGREERLSSFWQSYMRLAAFTDPVECLSLDSYMPSDRELFKLESDYIVRIAEKSSAIFLGRCGRYILREYPNHISTLVHAHLPERIKRIQQLYCLGEAEAKKLIETNDRERNASSLGLEKSVEIALGFIKDWADARKKLIPLG